MAWRVAKSLLKLRDQIDARYPNRNRASDGTIGDARHVDEGWDKSDHNSWYPPPDGGIVTAIDITHDPVNGVDIDRFTDELAASRDRRIKYIIANGWIMDTRPEFNPWVWVPYDGSNPHTKHFHLSVVASPLCDDDSDWDLPSLKEGDVTPQEMWSYKVIDQWSGEEMPAGALLGWIGQHVVAARRDAAANRAAIVELVKVVAANESVDVDALTERLDETIREAIADAVVDVNVSVSDRTG